MGEVVEALLQVGAKFDLIVSAPRVGLIPSQGIPAARRKKPENVGRRILANDASASVQIDNGFAAWIAANRLLSPLGEGLLVLSETSIKLMEETDWVERIWLRMSLGGNRTAVFFAADHRADSASPAPLIPYTEYEADRAFQNREKLIRGVTVSQFDTDPSSAWCFNTVREEFRRRNCGTPSWNISLNLENQVLIEFNDFQVLSGQLPKGALAIRDEFRKRRLLDIALLADTRARFTHFTQEKTVQCHPQIIKDWKEAVRQAETLRNPLNRPTPGQRIAWLDETGYISCTSDLVNEAGVVCLKAGVNYPIDSKVFEGRKIERRNRPGYGPETVLILGQELMLLVHNHEVGAAYAFTQFEVPENQRREFTFVTGWFRLNHLISNFKLPDVPDIAAKDPELYNHYVQKLHELETA
jgi:hypothetical protein